MPPKAAKPEGVLSEKEKEVLSLAWLYFKEASPKVNLPALAQALGYTNPGSVGNVITAATKKLKAQATIANGTGESSSAPATPAKTKGIKRKAVDDDDAGDGIVPALNLKKRGRKPVSKTAKAASVRDEADELAHENGHGADADADADGLV